MLLLNGSLGSTEPPVKMIVDLSRLTKCTSIKQTFVFEISMNWWSSQLPKFRFRFRPGVATQLHHWANILIPTVKRSATHFILPRFPLFF